MTAPPHGGPILGGVTVTLRSSYVSGQDVYGNDVRQRTSTEVGGCAFVPGSGSAIGTTEDIQGTEQVTQAAELYMPAGTVITPEDQVVVEGVTYEVMGAPSAWTSPFTMLRGPVQVHLRAVTGAGRR